MVIILLKLLFWETFHTGKILICTICTVKERICRNLFPMSIFGLTGYKFFILTSILETINVTFVILSQPLETFPVRILPYLTYFFLLKTPFSNFYFPKKYIFVSLSLYFNKSVTDLSRCWLLLNYPLEIEVRIVLKIWITLSSL